MRRFLTRSAILGAVVLSACSEPRQGLPSEPGAGPATTHEAGHCPTLAELKTLTQAVFTRPNANSVLGRLDNLQHQLSEGNQAEAVKLAIDLVDFINKKWKSKQGLNGTEAQLAELINGILCFAGIDVSLTDLGGIVITTASDTEERDGYRDDGQAGFVAPPGAFDAPNGTPVIVTISNAPAGLLNTLLDQYPGAFDVQASVGLNEDIVLGVCLSVDVPTSVLARLRLGHDLEDNEFEITPAADPPPGLTCDPTPPPAGPSVGFLNRAPAWLLAVGRFFLPQSAVASVLSGGGVGGSAGKLSTFSSVDPLLSASGGTGGSAGKLSPPALSRVLADDARPSDELNCEFPAGTDVSAECRPQVTIMTAQYKAWLDGGQVGPQQGNLIPGVSVTFEVGTGGGVVTGGTVATFDGESCGTHANQVIGSTDNAGFASACWKLSATPGINKVWVTPAPGDLPADVFFEPADLTFFATGTTPAGFSDDFETDAGWTATGFWHRSTLKDGSNNPFINSAYTDGLVNLATGDGSAGALPAPFGGSFSFWYGEDPPKGNYIGTRANSIVGSGGTSTSANSGSLTSPEFVVPASGVLSFETWFEIESVNPSSFDLMSVWLVRVDPSGADVLLGRLNPTGDPSGTTAATPFTSGGFNLPPAWIHVTHSLSAYAGQTVRIKFTFGTGDVLYNGFRGWLIDNVEVAGPSVRWSGLQALQAAGGGLNPPAPPGSRSP